MEKFCSSKVVARLLLRDIVREITGRKFVVHVSDSALDVLLGNASTGFVSISVILCLHVFDQCCDFFCIFKCIDIVTISNKR